MWQGYVYVNDVRYSNIFTFAVGIFFVNASQKERVGPLGLALSFSVSMPDSNLRAPATGTTWSQSMLCDHVFFCFRHKKPPGASFADAKLGRVSRT